MVVIKVGDEFWKAIINTNGTTVAGFSKDRDEAVYRAKQLAGKRRV
jgi:hypothetical protein